MELFRGRYLCFIAFLFLAASLAASRLTFLPKLISLIFFAIASLGALAVLFLSKKRRFASLVALLSLAAVLLAFLSSFLSISLPQKRVSELDERFSAELSLISLEHSDEYGSEYVARIERVNGDAASIKCYLSCPFASEFSFGDKLLATLEVEYAGSRANFYDDDIILFVEIPTGEQVLYSRAEQRNIFSPDGFRVFTKDLRSRLSSYVDSVFGDGGALVKGMLINDRSDLSDHTRSQFSRAGASHLLAVSGLHVSLLLGAIELLLRKLLAPKKLRVALISVCGLVLLALTDFSPSAVRSVLMLFSVYIAFMLSDENDAPTALFVAISLIVLISPYSVGDVGMWLSFSATLGLVVVYPVLDKKLPRPKKSRGLSRRLISLGLGALRVALITIVANFSTLPIMYVCFGTFSLVSIPANIMLSPLSALFLPLCVISLLLGRIAYVGGAVVACAKGVGSAILFTVELFSGLRGALVSLRYPFAYPLILIFAVATAVLLVIKLKRKILVALPALCVTVCFAVCLGVFALTDKTEISYLGRRTNEFVTVERAGVISVCDISTGADGAYALLSGNMCEYTTEIENYVITHLHAAHADMIDRISALRIIRRIYIPLEAGNEALGYAAKLYEAAKRYGCEVVFYHSGDEIKLSDSLFLRSFFDSGTDGHTDVFFSIYGEQGELSYSDRSISPESLRAGKISRYFIVGAHGERAESGAIEPDAFDASDCTLIYATEDCVPSEDAPKGYIVKSSGTLRKFSFRPD